MFVLIVFITFGGFILKVIVNINYMAGFVVGSGLVRRVVGLMVTFVMVDFLLLLWWARLGRVLRRQGEITLFVQFWREKRNGIKVYIVSITYRNSDRI